MKIVVKEITLEKVKASDYWKLLSIIIWNHYSEKEFQDEEKISFHEEWYGKQEHGSSHSNKWNNPEYTEPGYERALYAIVITFKRSDYTTYIYVNTHGNINTFGVYEDKDVKSSPHYHGAEMNLSITNWMLENDLLEITE